MSYYWNVAGLVNFALILNWKLDILSSSAQCDNTDLFM